MNTQTVMAIFFGTLMIGLGFLATQSQKHLPFPTCPQPCGVQDLSRSMDKAKVEDASVIYSYRYDTCFDPQSDPSCPGYEETVEVPEIEIYDPLADQLVLEELENKARIQKEEEEQERQRRREQWALSNALEELLSDGDNPGLIDPEAEAMALALTARVLPTNYYDGLEGREYLEDCYFRRRGYTR